MKHTVSALKFGLAVVLFVLLFRNFNIKVSALATEIADWRYLVAALCTSLIIPPFLAIRRWQLFLRVSGIIEGFFALWRILLIALFQGLMLPSTQGSDVLRIYYIDRRHPNRRGVAGSTVLIERMIGLVLLVLLSIVALPFSIRGPELLPLFLTIAAVGATVFLALALVLNKKLHGLYSGKKFANVTITHILGYIGKFHGAVVHFPYRKVLPSSLFWIAGFQLANIFTIYLVFCSYGYVIPFLQHVAIFPVIAILSMAPITIGGFGVREGFFVFFYSLVGVPPTVAVGASILQYIILMLVPAALGGVLLLWGTLGPGCIRLSKATDLQLPADRDGT